MFSNFRIERMQQFAKFYLLQDMFMFASAAPRIILMCPVYSWHFNHQGLCLISVNTWHYSIIWFSRTLDTVAIPKDSILDLSFPSSNSWPQIQQVNLQPFSRAFFRIFSWLSFWFSWPRALAEFPLVLLATVKVLSFGTVGNAIAPTASMIVCN